MTDHTVMFGQTSVYLVSNDGPTIAVADDALDILGDVFGAEAHCAAIATSRFDDSFFDLSTRLAGEFLQKFVNYRVVLCIVGDISSQRAASSAFDAFVAESNRGQHIWFLPTLDALESKLQG